MTLDELIERLQDIRDGLSGGDVEVLVVHQPGYLPLACGDGLAGQYAKGGQPALPTGDARALLDCVRWGDRWGTSGATGGAEGIRRHW